MNDIKLKSKGYKYTPLRIVGSIMKNIKVSYCCSCASSYKYNKEIISKIAKDIRNEILTKKTI